MIPLPWSRRAASTAAQARVAQIERDACAKSKGAAEANIAELRAKRAQLNLNAILDDVIAASLTAAKEGGQDDGT